MADHEAINDPYGHQADAPGEMPRRAWRDILARTYKRTWDDNVALVSAGVAFYAFFALLSLLGLIVISYSFVAEPGSVIILMSRLTAVLPRDVAAVIAQQLLTLVESSSKAKGVGLLIAIAVATYGGTNGASAVITALNIAYEEKEKRGLVRFYVLAIVMTFGALVVSLLAIAGTAALSVLERWFPQVPSVIVLGGKLLGYLVLVLVAAGVAATLYRFAPSRERALWRWITPGSMFAATAWVLLTVAFGFYLGHLANYKASYGSLGAVVAMQSWMYFSAYAFVFGAELNSEIEHQTAKDSTTGPPRPMGDRGAWAADNVATDSKVQDRPEEKREGEKLTQAAPKVADEEG